MARAIKAIASSKTAMAAGPSFSPPSGFGDELDTGLGAAASLSALSEGSDSVTGQVSTIEGSPRKPHALRAPALVSDSDNEPTKRPTSEKQ